MARPNKPRGKNSGKNVTQTRVPFKLDNDSFDWLIERPEYIRNQFINQAVAEKIKAIKALEASQSQIHPEQ